MKRFSLLTSLWLLPALPVLAQVQIGGGTCNSATLTGSYELTISGRQVSTTGTIQKATTLIGTAAFDGLSKVTFNVSTPSAANMAFGAPQSYSGTYTVQSNCQGSMTFTGANASTFNISVYTAGKAFALNGSDATYAYNGSGNIQAPTACQTSTLTGAHEFNGNGLTFNGTTVSGFFDYAGLLQFDGQGGITASWSTATNASLTNVSATGTYTLSAGCTGTAALTDAANNKYSVVLSVYSTAPDFVIGITSPVVFMAGSGSAAQPSGTGKTCTVSSVNGNYEFTLSGRQVNQSGTTVALLQSVGTLSFDGQGHVSVAVTATTNMAAGVPFALTGTYVLQPSCQGTATFSTGIAATFTLIPFAVDNTGLARNFVVVGSDPSYAYSGSGALEPSVCAASTLSGAWPFTATGSTLSGTSITGPQDLTGLLQFDGQGKVTGNWNSYTNTGSGSASVTGTYTLGSNCVGTATLTDTLNNKYSIALAIPGVAAANVALVASNPQLVFTGTGHAAFVNPGLAVGNAASFATSATPAGSVFSLFGSNLSTAVGQPGGVPLPTKILSTSLTVNGELAPLFYVSSGQINAQMPVDIKPGLATIVVTNGTTVSNAVAVTVPSGATPGIIVYGDNRAVVVNATQANQVVSTSVPAKPNDVLVAYFTGGGPVQSGGLLTGAVAPGQSQVSGTATVAVAGKDAKVNYIGLTPGGIGLYQANFVMPTGIAAGDRTVVINIGGVASNNPLMAVAN